MKILITESQLRRIINEDDFEIKLKSIFDKFMKKYTDLIKDEKQWLEDYEIHTCLVFFKKNEDGEIDDDDWEDDNYVFKIIPIDDYGNDLLLEYGIRFLSPIMESFGDMFDSLLKEWFEEHYKYKISKISGVR